LLKQRKPAPYLGFKKWKEQSYDDKESIKNKKVLKQNGKDKFKVFGLKGRKK